MAFSRGIIYYTANSESPEFEKRLQGVIIANSGGLPIVSCSQKPMDFGKNICVGDIGNSYDNEFKQMLVAAKESTADYIFFCEADFLYPPEYFAFEPSGEDVCRYDNVWLVFNRSNAYYRKNYSNGAMICKRDFVVRELEYQLANNIPWKDWEPSTYFHGDSACLSFRTGQGLTSKGRWMSGAENKQRTLPYWGNVVELKQKYPCLL